MLSGEAVEEEKYYLVVVTDAGDVRIKLRQGENYFGRPDFIGVMKDIDKLRFISRRHFVIRCSDDGCYVRDENSKNGTWLNNERLGNEWRRLSDNDVINVAGVLELRFVTKK